MRIDITGLRSGKLVALYPTNKIKSGYVLWMCQCDCGNKKEIRSSHLVDGRIKACGCNGGAKTHGMKNTPMYRSWIHMRSRCYDTNCFPYKDYGGRGIKMSPEWRADFMNFYNDMKDTWKPGLTVDRIDVNGDYEKFNCRWLSRSEQVANRRCSRWVETLEGRMTITQAANRIGISYLAMFQRIRQGWPIEKLLLPSNFKQRIMPYRKHAKWQSGSDNLKWPEN